MQPALDAVVRPVGIGVRVSVEAKSDGLGEALRGWCQSHITGRRPVASKN